MDFSRFGIIMPIFARQGYVMYEHRMIEAPKS